jgi:hydrogenase maturation protein HypF
MAVAALSAMGLRDEAKARWGERATRLLGMIDADVACPRTSSAGRWFDAAAGLLGVRDAVSYEGEAAMLLEAQVRTPRVLRDAYRIDDGVLDLLPLLRALRGLSVTEGADAFHGTLAHALVEWVATHAGSRGVHSVALSGGCFANRVLTEAVARGLRDAGLRPLIPSSLPMNDGGLSVGQALIAGLSRPPSGDPCASPFPPSS